MNEVTTLRTRFGKTFALGGERFETRIYPFPVHFEEQGAWRDYSLGWVQEEYYGWERFALLGSPLKVRVGDNPGTKEVELLDLTAPDGSWITLKARGVKKGVTPIVSPGSIFFPKLLKNADFEVRVDPYGKVSRVWVFRKKVDHDWVDTVLMSSNLHIEQNDDGSLLLATPQSGVFLIHNPYMEAFFPDGRTIRLEHGLHYELGEHERYTSIRKVLTDEVYSWIDTQFNDGAMRIELDPTISIPDYVLTQMAQVSNIWKNDTAPQNNFDANSNKFFNIGGLGGVSGNPVYRLLWKPDLADAMLQAAANRQASLRIPRGAKLTLLKSSLFLHDSKHIPTGVGADLSSVNVNVQAHRILKAWTDVGVSYSGWNKPDTGGSTPVWNGCPPDGTNAVIAPSANTILIETTTGASPPSPGNWFAELELTADVQAFLDGTYVNNGWMIRGLTVPGGIEDPTTDTVIVPNSQGSTDTTEPPVWHNQAYRPYLSLVYGYTLASPATVTVNPNGVASNVINIESSPETREDATVIYWKDNTIQTTYIRMTSNGLHPREKCYVHSGLTDGRTYSYKVRHYNEQRHIGWPRAEGTTTPSRPEIFESNAEHSYSFYVVSSDATHIVLPSTASSTDDYYNGWEVYFYEGTNVGEAKVITDYDGTLRKITVGSAWSVNPTTTSLAVVRPYIPLTFGSADANFPNDKNNYDYKIVIASLVTDDINTVDIYRKRSHDTSYPGVATYAGVSLATSPSWTTVGDSTNLKIRQTGAGNLVAGDVGKYWEISCYGGWSEYSTEVSLDPESVGSYSGSYTTGGSGRDDDFDDFGNECFHNTQMAGPAEQQYVTLEGQNYVFKHTGVWVSGVKDLGSGASAQTETVSKTDVTTDSGGNPLTEGSYVDTTRLATRDSAIAAVNEATIEIRSSNDIPDSDNGGYVAPTANYNNAGSWTDKDHAYRWDDTWGMDNSIYAKYEVRNSGYIYWDGATYNLTIGDLFYWGKVQGSGGNPDKIYRGFVSLDLSEISLEEISDFAFLLLPIATGTNIKIYHVDWGDILTTTAYNQSPTWGETDGLLWNGVCTNSLDGYSLQLVIKTPEIRNAVRRAIREGRKFLRMRIQQADESVYSTTYSGTLSATAMKFYYKLILPFTQIISGQRIPASLRKRYYQRRVTVQRGYGSVE